MYCHKSILDDLSLVYVANEFVGLKPDWKNSFGKFTEKTYTKKRLKKF